VVPRALQFHQSILGTPCWRNRPSERCFLMESVLRAGAEPIVWSPSSSLLWFLPPPFYGQDWSDQWEGLCFVHIRWTFLLDVLPFLTATKFTRSPTCMSVQFWAWFDDPISWKLKELELLWITTFLAAIHHFSCHANLNPLLSFFFPWAEFSLSKWRSLFLECWLPLSFVRS
jgi:hypothetical protein